jgi:hypothetical protein
MDTVLFRHFNARFDTFAYFDAAHFKDAACSDVTLYYLLVWVALSTLFAGLTPACK